MESVIACTAWLLFPRDAPLLAHGWVHDVTKFADGRVCFAFLKYGIAMPVCEVL